MNSIRRHFSYANVVATFALVFAMSGGALAVSHYLINSTRQINPKVLKRLAGTAGRAGPAGPAGTTGAIGPSGQRGAQGEPGSLGPKGETGPSGISGYQRVVGAFVKGSGTGINLASANATCPVGTSVLGGGFEAFGSTGNIGVVADAPMESEGWQVKTTSGSTSTYEVAAFAICAKVTS